MQLHLLFAIMAPAMVTVQATCFRSGPEWSPTKQIAIDFVNSICNSNGVSGYFPEGMTKYRCKQLRDNVKGEFWVNWKGRGNLSLNDNDCKGGLINEINGCSKGGESTIAQWYYR